MLVKMYEVTAVFPDVIASTWMNSLKEAAEKAAEWFTSSVSVTIESYEYDSERLEYGQL